MKIVKAPGFTAYAAILLWFLLTVMWPREAGAAETVHAAELAAPIAEALRSKGAPEGVSVLVDEPQALIPAGAATAPFDAVSYNPATGRFLIRLGGGSEAYVAGHAAGDRPDTVETKNTATLVPVLARPLARGAVIAEDDIAWREVPPGDPRAIASSETLVGKETRRAIPAGSPVAARDVVAPTLVKKGGLVTIEFERAGLRLTHAGLALAAGAEGDVVDVRNVKSDVIVRAVVAGPNRVFAITAASRGASL